jgi:hypothetical protein
VPTQLQLWHFVDVAIGLTFCYLSLGLMASSFKELVAGALNWRGRRLRDALRVLLDHAPSAARSGQTLFSSVFHHGLICPDPKDRAPSYIAAHNFSAALTAALTRGGATQPLLEQIATGVAELPPGRVHDSLQALLTQAQGDLDRFNAGVERWFDDAMDRLSGAYKRFCGYFLLAFGVVVAVGFNIDSIEIAGYLWKNPEVAAVVAEQAQAAVAAAPAASDVAAGSPQALALLQATTVPFGWGPGVSVGPLKLLGWFATALAVSLGAPFWFDLIGRLLNLRATGPRPKRSEQS